MVLYLISLLVFLGVGSGFMKSGLDVRLFVWDHFILFNIPLENTTMNVHLDIVYLQLATLSEYFRIIIICYGSILMIFCGSPLPKNSCLHKFVTK